MNKFSRLIIVLAVIVLPVCAAAQSKFSMEDVVSRALTQSPAFKLAETRKENRFWQYRYFRTNYNPQLRMSSNNAGSLYNNSFTPVRQPDGSIEYRPLNQLNPGMNFGLQQPIQWTGGMIFVNSSYNYFNNITNDTRQWNGAPFNIFVNQPLFAFNPYKWDLKIEPIRYEESKREYAESMEQISSDAVAAFFNVLQAQVNAQIAQFNLANNDTIYKIEQGRYNIGTTSQDKLLQVELQLLRSRQDVAQADLDLQTASLRLRTFIGLRSGERFDLNLPDNIPQFDVSEEEALQYARQNRAAFIAFERRKMEADQAVAQAKGERYQVGVTASYGTNNVGSTVGDLYQNPARQQMANVTFNVPLVDWGRRKALMRTAIANKRLNDYIIAQDEVTFEQEIITQVRQFEMLRLQIEITRKADEVAQERYMVAQNRYLIGKIDITNLNIALNEKDTAKRSYLEALKSFWTAYYDLRRLTLYDFANKRLLYIVEQ
ncbi:MAG: TolC family protein [Cyclobacteriaceae bacterium]|nr:TolC family protein [Cyclobacteriaceae bacterium]